MEKKIVDLEKLTAEELLNELADRLIAHEESGLRLSQWKAENNYSEEDGFNAEYDDLKTDHDEDWCRIREVVRFIKGDNTIWEC